MTAIVSYFPAGSVVSEKAGTQFQLDMISEALTEHDNGCCTGDRPCTWRVGLVATHRKLSGQVRTAREEAPQTVTESPRTGGGSGRAVADPATDRQISFIRSLANERDLSGLTTLSARTLDEVRREIRISKGRASRLIEALQRLPRTAPQQEVRTGTDRPASPAQISLLESLSRKVGEPIPADLTRAQASGLIGRWMEIRTSGRTDRAGSGQITQDGIYRTPDGEIYKVQVAVHRSGRLYAKRLVKLEVPRQLRNKTLTHEFVYEEGALAKLTPEMRLTLEQAKELGRSADSPLYGTCCRCGAVLTDETSIAQGIGPDCGKKF